MTKGIAPNCRRLHCDLPIDLYEKMQAAAAAPPAIPVAEWARRLIAWKLNHDLPKASERKKMRIRLTGEPRKKTGPKHHE